MLIECLRSLLRVLGKSAELFFKATAIARPAIGNAAPDADTTEIQTISLGGVDPLPEEKSVASEELQAITRKNLHEAVEQFLKANYGAGILTDFALVAETVEPNLDNEVDEHMLWLGTSKGLSTWRLMGLATALSRIAYAQVGA